MESKLKKGANYYANIALKFNLKTGGANHQLPDSKLGFLAQKTTMLVGIDVTHPSPGSMVGTPSIAGVVASVDDKFAQWPASIRCQESRKEMVEDLQIMMRDRLNLWSTRNNGRLPDKILVYRDGVSEGQYKTVLSQELTGIRKALDEVYGRNPHPKITILIVTKRHHTRFYPTKTEDADSRGNMKNGTIVDRGITIHRGFDFYLQAHTALTGTVSGSRIVPFS